jgi:hypothetical protein
MRRLVTRNRWPWRLGSRFYMPPRIAFEPRARDERVGVDAAHAAVRAAWGRGQPAVVSTHRASYAHLDAAESGAGRGALKDLLSRLTLDGATFLVDAEVRQLADRGWSVRALGDRGALLRSRVGPRESLSFPAPAHVSGVALREGAVEGADLSIDAGTVTARVPVGEYLIEWQRT